MKVANKTISVGGRQVVLVKHAVTSPVYGKQPCEAGRDGSGNLYFKGKTVNETPN